MGNLAPPAGGAPPSPDEMAEIARLAEAVTGIVISEAKTSMIQSRLAGRLRALGLPDWRAYLDLVASPRGEDERRELVSALTTNVSHFFREAHHFELLRGTVLPPLAERARAGGRVRIWSAGCSNGQEAYSIAMTLAEVLPEAARHDIRILATDIDPKVLATAERAEYDAETLRDIPPALAARYVERTCGGSGSRDSEGGGRIAAPIRNLIAFRELNLHGDWPMRHPFDVVFCRNVMIYFSPERRARLIDRFAGAMPAGAWLILGHSERSPNGPDAPFRSAGITAYRRTERAPQPAEISAHGA
jgi:chemotaxis protein methyltransferase CheR